MLKIMFYFVSLIKDCVAQNMAAEFAIR